MERIGKSGTVSGLRPHAHDVLLVVGRCNNQKRRQKSTLLIGMPREARESCEKRKPEGVKIMSHAKCKNDEQDWPLVPVMQTVTELCAELGIELRGDDGQPFHCGERMRVKSGLMGPDYAECRCGLKIGNMASPHVSGCFPSQQWLEENGNRTWLKLEWE